MTENNMLPERGLVSEWAEEDILVFADNSGYKTGTYAGVLGGEVLNGLDSGPTRSVTWGVLIELVVGLTRRKGHSGVYTGERHRTTPRFRVSRPAY